MCNSQTKEKVQQPKQQMTKHDASMAHFSTPRDYLDNVRVVDRAFKRAAGIVVIVWLSLLLVATIFTPPEQFEPLEGTELMATSFAFFFLLLSILGRLCTVLWLEPKKTNISGVLIGSFTVKGVALLTNALFASGMKVPVLRDPVFGNRVFVYRWCEWTPLAFYMTMLTSGVDAEQSLRQSYTLGLTQGLSTLMGLFLPYCSSNKTWGVTMVISCILYFLMFPTLRASRKRYLALLSSHRRRGGRNSAFQEEIFERSRLSYQLLTVCTGAWTALVVMYFIAGAGYRLRGTRTDGQHWFIQSDSFSMIWESIMDVILKNLYMNLIVKVHRVAFDDGARAERRLTELRRLMSAVWERSSDVICVSVRHGGGKIRTMVSPVYLQCYHASNQNNNSNAETAFWFDMEETYVDRQWYSEITPQAVRAIDFHSQYDTSSGGVGGVEEAFGGGGNLHEDSNIVNDLDPTLLKSLATMIARSWNHNTTANVTNQKQQQPGTITQDLLKKTNKHGITQTSCEANICQLEQDAILLIIRDISERSKRFEAEKKMIVETVARKKDAEVNRFTRHEVKNGLLAAIELCEGLKETTTTTNAPETPVSMSRQPSPLELPSDTTTATTTAVSPQQQSHSSETTTIATATTEVAAISEQQNNIRKNSCNMTNFTHELDKTLKHILDTILSEAMARDVIHGNYAPKLERVNIEQLLHEATADFRDGQRFPILSDSQFPPSLQFDPQLLLCIYRNAMSNACKYGQSNGKVTTRIHYDKHKQVLTLNVINLPGTQHDRLLSLGSEAARMVFEPGKRLHTCDEQSDNNHNNAVSTMETTAPNDTQQQQQQNQRQSAGDGAWIISKCAQTLNGTVSIRFEPQQTTFSFVCPARQNNSCPKVLENFQIPSNTWGVAIDDSKIQRKLLSKFITHLGIEESQQVIQGSSSEEIHNFDTFLIQFVKENPQDYFLVIVDENLDVIEDNGTQLRSTVSGSECIERVRKRLGPEDEHRMLALIRSANDSGDDIALYKRRAHGFILKAPIRRASVLETIAPLWEERFRHVLPQNKTATSSSSSNPTKLMDQASYNHHSAESMNDFIAMVVKELKSNVEIVNKMCSSTKAASVSHHWPLIWEKLHCLKGDLLSIFQSPSIEQAVTEINRMRGPTIPKDFEMRWRDLRNQIMEITSVLNGSSNSHHPFLPEEALAAETVTNNDANDSQHLATKRCSIGTLEDGKLSKKPRTDKSLNNIANPRKPNKSELGQPVSKKQKRQ